MTESTADVYTREKRNVVTAIWTKVADKVKSIKMTLGRERREDLNHGDWDDPVTEVVDADARPPDSPPHSSRRSMAATPPCDAASPLPDKVTPGANDFWDVVEGEDNGLAPLLAQAIDLPKEGDQVDQDYPYQVISSNTAGARRNSCGSTSSPWRASAWAVVEHPDDRADPGGVLGQPHGLWQMHAMLFQG